MRTKILLICIVVLGLCVWVLLQRGIQRVRTGLHENKAVFTNQPLVSRLAPPKEAEKKPNGSVSVSIAPPRTKLETSDALYQQFLAEWRAPIDFYGKVVDEKGAPVQGAKVVFQWTETPPMWGEDTEEQTGSAVTESDEQGLFSLRGKRGGTLTVWVSKEGYYASRGGRQIFLYSFPNSNGKFIPDPQNPVVFCLKKKGVGEELVAVKRNYRVRRDGTPLKINLATGNATTGSDADLVVQCWTDDCGKRSGEKYDWRCLITIPGGGLALTEEEFPFLAPENGYVPTTEIVMPAARPDWKSDVELKFYYRLADGRFGRMTFSMIAGGDHFCMIESFLNPTGSRNLEPKE